jgi:hypothetical protein
VLNLQRVDSMEFLKATPSSAKLFGAATTGNAPATGQEGTPTSADAPEAASTTAAATSAGWNVLPNVGSAMFLLVASLIIQ